jgi:hypothetical protein
MVIVESPLLALTRTPSIGPSWSDVTLPISAAFCANATPSSIGTNARRTAANCNLATALMRYSAVSELNFLSIRWPGSGEHKSN